MLSTGIPELRCEEDLDYLRMSFGVEQTDEEASKKFKELINESLNCFPTDHQILTEHGFYSLDDVCQHFTTHAELRVACYVHARLEYHAIKQSDVTVAEGQHRLIVMHAAGRKSNHVSLTPTDNHRMFVRMGPTVPTTNRSFYPAQR